MAPKAKEKAASRSQSPATKAKAKAAPAGKAAVAPKAKAGPSPEEEAKRKAEEEEAKAKAEEEARLQAEREEKEKAEAEAKAEEDRKRNEAAQAEIKRIQALANGEVTIRYSHYTEKFPIKDHKLTAKTIDETYGLTDVMPGCFMHLAEKEFAHMEEHQYMKEDPLGTFWGLMAGETYWCYVQQDAKQEKLDQEKVRKQYAGGVAAGIGDRGSEEESCSCGWGAPCTNAIVCNDFDNRFANALKAGGNPAAFVHVL